MNTARSRTLLSVSLAAALLAMSSPCFAAGEVDLLVGNKWFAAQGDRQTQGVGVALLTSFGGKTWPVWVACDVSGNFGTDWRASDPGAPGLDMGSVDIHPGVRKVWDSRRWRTSVGAGPAIHLVLAGVTSSAFQVGSWPEVGGGSAVGFWVNGRSAVRFGHFQVGLDARLSRAKSSIDLEETHLSGPTTSRAVDFESGGQSVGLFLGMGW